MRHISAYNKYLYYLKNYADTRKIKNILLNRFEARKKRSVLKSRPYKVTIDPGNFCNLRCPGCHTGIKHPEMIGPGFMKYSDYKVIFGQLQPYAMSVALYNWGEPFLNKQLFDMVAHTTENRVGTTVHSNFNVFDEQKAIDAVKSGLTHIYLSIDGAGQEAYVKYRVKGDLEQVLDNVKTMVEVKKRMNSRFPLLTWKFLQFDHNRHEVNEAAEMAEAIGVDAFETFEAWPKLMDIYDEAEDYQSGKKTLNEKDFCHSLWSGIYVNPEGSVLPCSLAFRKNESFGNLLYDSMDNIWNNSFYASARRMFTQVLAPEDVPMPCRGCKYFNSGKCEMLRQKAD